MTILNRFILFLFLLKTHIHYGQNPYSFSGKVYSTEGEALAFVAILPNDDVNKGVLSDIEGRFNIHSKTPITTLTFRCVGFETLKLDANALKKYAHTPLSITLKNADNNLSEVIIAAGENPADRIMRRVIVNRDKNNPEKLRTFQCKTYNKVAFEILPNDSIFSRLLSKKDTSRQRIKELQQNFQKTQRQNQEHQAFLMETVTERKFRFPNDNFERVILNRVSGFPNSGMVALANMIQPFSFYGDFLRIIDKNYVNPVSIGSPSSYFFNIEDTLYQGIDTVFIISFHPRKGKVFEGLAGVLHINSRQWAVQNVKAKPSNASISHLKIEQQYQFDTTAGQWFPEQLNFELEFPKYPLPYMGMRAVGRSYISDVAINPAFQQKDFLPETPLIIEKTAFNTNDTIWSNVRANTPLSIREQRTYEWLDSLSQKKRFDLWSKGLNALASGRLPIKNSAISLDLRRILRTNNYENMRLGLGLTTAPAAVFSRPKFWESSVYTGYGLRDSAWKYGGDIKFRLSPSTQTTIQVNYMHDLREPGAVTELDPIGLVSRSFYSNRFDTNDEWALSLSSRFKKRFNIKITGRQQFLKPNYTYSFYDGTGDAATDFRFTEISTQLKYVFNEQNPSFLGETLNEINKIPVFEVGYTHGFDGILRGQYTYDKWLFAVHQSVMIRRLGRMVWRVEGGIIRGNVPLAKLFTLNQSGGRGILAAYVPNTFQTINDSITRLSDRFLNVYFVQSLGNILYRLKWSSPQLSIAQNMAWGQLSHPEYHRNIHFTTPSIPLVESGLVLDNLLKINYFNFSNIGIGGAVFYRWGSDISSFKNLNLRLTLRMSL